MPVRSSPPPKTTLTSTISSPATFSQRFHTWPAGTLSVLLLDGLTSVANSPSKSWKGNFETRPSRSHPSEQTSQPRSRKFGWSKWLLFRQCASPGVAFVEKPNFASGLLKCPAHVSQRRTTTRPVLRSHEYRKNTSTRKRPCSLRSRRWEGDRSTSLGACVAQVLRYVSCEHFGFVLSFLNTSSSGFRIH